MQNGVSLHGINGPQWTIHYKHAVSLHHTHHTTQINYAAMGGGADTI